MKIKIYWEMMDNGWIEWIDGEVILAHKHIQGNPTKTLGGIAILENGKAPIKQQLLP